MVVFQWLLVVYFVYFLAKVEAIVIRVQSVHEADLVVLADSSQTVQNIRGSERLRLVDQMQRV